MEQHLLLKAVGYKASTTDCVLVLVNADAKIHQFLSLNRPLFLFDLLTKFACLPLFPDMLIAACLGINLLEVIQNSSL